MTDEIILKGRTVSTDEARAIIAQAKSGNLTITINRVRVRTESDLQELLNTIDHYLTLPTPGA